MKKFSILGVLIALFTARITFGQLPSLQMTSSPALTKLFGSNTSFTAKLELRLVDKDQKEYASLIANIAVLDGKKRAEMDMAQMKSKQMPGALADLKQMGLDRVAAIVRPDKKVTYLIYPNLRAYVTLPLKKDEAQDAAADLKMGRTAITKETFDGHPCEINRVLITSDGSQEFEAVVWNAQDLKDFPVKIQWAPEGGNNAILEYKQVNLLKPDAKQFEAPAGFSAYDDMQQLQAAAAERMKLDKAGPLKK